MKGNTSLFYEGDVGVLTHQGKVRESNQDCVCANHEIGLWLVADGMGGHRSGGVASQITRDSIEQNIVDGVGLSEAIRISHANIIKVAKKNSEDYGMGSTVVAVLLDHTGYSLAWVGDSRAYIWDGHLKQLTRDHSYVESLLDIGAITEGEAVSHPSRHLITRCLGAGEFGDDIEVDERRCQFMPGQELLLCSDGLTDEVTDAEIEEILTTAESAQNRVDCLVGLALEKGGHDNVSVILLSAPKNTRAANKTSIMITLAKKLAFVTIGGLLAVVVLGLSYYFRT